METIGKPIARKEDARLLTGAGQFTDDASVPGQVYAAMVRSPYPHARILEIRSETALDIPGVLAVYTGDDCAADGLGAIPHNPLPKTKHDLMLTGPGGSEVFIGPHMLLPSDKVRHAGEAVAMVVAESQALAEDGVEAVAVDYETLPHNTDAKAAAEGDQPAVWEQLPGNVCIDNVFGDVSATDAAFAEAAHVVSAQFHIGRVTGVPIEPRAALAIHDARTGRTTLHAGSGGAVRQKHEIAAVLGEDPANLRVLSFDVGGNFGTRNRVYVEVVLTTWAAKKLGRPVKFTAGRGEALLTDYQGRDLHTSVELALDTDGHFLAMRADNISNVGARAVSFSPIGKGSNLVTGNYRIPTACVRARAVFTNTMPTQAYRSSGRPEVTYAIERLVEIASQELDIDPIELRRRNLVDLSEMPYANPLGMVYDSGDYKKCIAMALARAGWDGINERRAEAKSRGRLHGVGVASYVESSIGTPREQARITVTCENRIDVVIGTQPSGQGHETSFAQVAAELLGVPMEWVNICIGDTDVVGFGGGSHSGRSMRMAGTVIIKAAEVLVERGRQMAAEIFEAAETDVEFSDGTFRVKGTDRALTLFQLAAQVEPGALTATESNEMHTPVFPNGCHVCEVEVDAETGAVQIVRYAAVDDVGRAINPLIVDGQTHGGIVQGVGQALWEECVFDSDGQPLSGSFMDYGMPRADHFPSFQTALNQVPSPTNPLGVKAGGEGGTTPAPGVMVNAVVDALQGFGVENLTMPLTPLRIWQAMRGAN
ncbi:MAG: xanthine dehydrogenase family protein molybdopterin-binding subunit [Pseudomonadota bacterium]|nr:xanthine dehydrogenase family protein molybdopterin-binding subunit [Pseudomonadota bacterium]